MDYNHQLAIETAENEGLPPYVGKVTEPNIRFHLPEMGMPPKDSDE